jgi:hypothetical protein
MRRATSLTAGQRAFVWTFRRLTTVFAGFPDPFVEEHVRMEGVRGYLRWAKSGMELLALLEKRFGVVEAQLVIGFAALWTGCRWCGVGHVLAANLEQFRREEGVLGPLDELRIPDLQMKTDPEVLEELLQRFSGARWEKLNRLIERQYLLRTDQVEAESHDDELLQTTNVLWDWVVECSITAMDCDPTTIPAQSPIGKDRKLLARYYAARKQTATISAP